MHSFKSAVTQQQAIALTTSDVYCHSQSPFYLRFSKKLAFYFTFWRDPFFHVFCMFDFGQCGFIFCVLLLLHVYFGEDYKK